MTAALSNDLLRQDRLTRWHAIFAALMAALGIFATRSVWRDIYLIASKDEEYSHIFLVPVVVIWMVWVRRMRFRHCKPSGQLLGPVLVAIGWAMNSLGFYYGVQSFWHGGAIVVVIGCIVAVTGKNVLFRFFPAVAVLIFLVPMPGRIREAIALPLERWEAQIAQVLLQMLGVDTERSGNQLTINGHGVNFAEACNGQRMVFPLILIMFAFSFGLPLKNFMRFLLLLTSPLVALVCNVIRTVPTVWLFGNASKPVAQAFHDYAGWAMLPLAFFVLLGFIKMLRWAMIPVMQYTLASQA